MEPEDLPWPGELEEEEDKEEEREDEGVVVEELAGKMSPAEPDLSDEFQRRDSTDEEDEEAEAWLQAPPTQVLTSWDRYSEDKRSCVKTPPVPVSDETRCRKSGLIGVPSSPALFASNSRFPGLLGNARSWTGGLLGCPMTPRRPQVCEGGGISLQRPQVCGVVSPVTPYLPQKMESWHCLPRKIYFSQTSDTLQTRLNTRERKAEITDFPSLEEGALAQSESQVKKNNRDYLCSPLLVIQDSFASPDLPLLTCLTRDQEFGTDSLYQQSEVEFAPLRGVPDRSEDCEWFSRPSEVSEALFQAASEATSLSSCFSVSQHPLVDASTIASQHSLSHPQLDNNDELNPPQGSTTYDVLCSYMSLKTQEIGQQCWKQEAPQPSGSCKDGDSLSDSSDTVDEKEIPEGNDTFDIPAASFKPWREQRPPHHLDAGLAKHLQESTDSDSTVEDATEHCVVDGHAVVSSERVAELLRESTRELEFHPSDLRMLRVFPEAVSKTLRQSPQHKTVVDHTSVFYHQTLPDSHLSDQTPEVSAVPALAKQRIEKPPVPYSSHSSRQKPRASYGYEFSDVYLAEKALKDPESAGQADESSEIARLAASRSTHRGKASLGYTQALPDSDLTEEILVAAPGPAAWKTEIETVPSSSSSYRGKPSALFRQELSDSHFPEELLKRPADQIGTPKVLSSFLQREQPDSLYQQALPDSHLTEEALQQSSPIPGMLPAQKTRLPVFENYYYQREKAGASNQQAWLDSHPTEQALKMSPVPGMPPAQKTGMVTVPTSSYLSREKPGVLYQQGLPNSHVTEEAQKGSFVPRQPEQKMLPDTPLSEETVRSSSVPDISAGLITEIPTLSSGSYPDRAEPGAFYRQESPDSNLSEETVRSLPAAGGPADQKTGLPAVPSSSHPQREKPGVFYQQVLQDGPLTEQTLESSPADQKTGIPAAPFSSSYAHGEKPGVFSQQALPDNHLTEETPKGQAVPGQPHQQAGILTEPFSSHSPLEKPETFFQQVLPDSQLTEESLKALLVPGPADQKTGIPTVTSSLYSQGEKPNIFHEQELLESLTTKEFLKKLPVDPKTGIQKVSSGSYLQREKSGIFYQQPLPDKLPTAESVKVFAVPGAATQKTGIPSIPSTSPSHKEEPRTLQRQELPDEHVPEESLNVLTVPGSAGPKTARPAAPSSSSHAETPSTLHQQALPDGQTTEEALRESPVPGPADQKTGTPTGPSLSSLPEEQPAIFYQQELSDIDLTEETPKVSAVTRPTDRKSRIPAGPPPIYLQSVGKEGVLSGGQLTEESVKSSPISGPADQETRTPTLLHAYLLPGEKPSTVHQQNFPDRDLTEEALKFSTDPGAADQKTRLLLTPESSYEHKLKVTGSVGTGADDQKTESLAAPDSHTEKPRISLVVGPDEQKTPLLTVVSSSYSQTIKPRVFFQGELPDRHPSEENLKILTIPEPTDRNPSAPVPLPSSYPQTEKSSHFYPLELSDKHLTDDTPTVSVPGPAGQKIVLPPSSFASREQSDAFSQQDLPGRHVTEGTWMVSGGFGQREPIIVLPMVPSRTSGHSEKDKPVSDRPQRVIGHFDSFDSKVGSKILPLKPQAEGGDQTHKPETIDFGGLGCEEIQNNDSSSKTLREIQTLLMEAENIALKRCNASAPLIPFKDVGDVSCVQPRKVVCFKEPVVAEECSVDLGQKQPLERNVSDRSVQKDGSTQTSPKCQRDAGNWEVIDSATVQSSFQEAEHKARVALEETFRQCETTKLVRRAEPQRCSGIHGSEIVIPVMTILHSDSSSDTSDGHGSCSWTSLLPESVDSLSDMVFSFLPDAASPTPSVADREEECVSESDDGDSSNVDSLAAHVKTLLECESSLNHAKQILRHAEEEECRVRARAWNLKFNLTHGCGRSISELNDDDRRKVEEIKAKLFSHEKTVDMSQGLQSPQGIECRPEAVCSHIIIESHEKGCVRTLMTQQNQLDGHPCVCRLDKPEVVLRGQQSSPPWRDVPCDPSRSLDQSHPHFRVWNSLQLRSHSPLQNFTASNFKISKDPQVPFRGKVDPWLSETVETVCASPEGIDLHSQPRLPPEPMKKFTTSITFSSHRHTKCVSDSSVFKVGVTEGGTTASVGVFKSHFTEEHHPHRAQNQRTSSPSAFKMCSHSPGENLAVLAETWQNQKFPIGCERSHQEVADCRADHRDASHSAHFSSMTRLRSPRGAKEKPAALPRDIPSLIFLEQRELLEQSKALCADYRTRKPSSPLPQHQDHLAPCLASPVFLEQRELLEQSKASNTDQQLREDPSSIPHGQDCVTVDLPSDIFLEQRKLFEQSQAAYVDTHYSSFPQDQECIAEKDHQLKPLPHVSDTLNIDDKLSKMVSQAVPRPCSPPSNRKAVSCVRITLSPKAPCKVDSGTLDKSCTSLDPISSSRTGEYDSELQTATSRSSDPTSEPKSSLDYQAFHFPGEGGKDLKVLPQHRQTQVSKSDLEGSLHPTGTPVSADRPHSIQKVSSDAVTQITTESSEKTLFTSEIFINAKDRSNKIPGSYPHWPFKTPDIHPSVQQKMTTRGTQAEPSLLPYKPSGSTQMYYVPELRKTPPPESKSDTTLESSHSGSNDAIAPVFPAQVLGTRDDDLSGTVNIKHKEGIYSKRAVTKPPWSVGEKPSQRDTAGTSNAIVVRKKDEDLTDTGIKHKEGLSSKRAVMRATWPVEEPPSHKDTAVQVTLIGDESLSDTKVKEDPCEKELLAVPTSVEEVDSAGCITENLPDVKAFKQREDIFNRRTTPRTAWTEEKKSLSEDAAESSCHAGLENTTHSVFQSAQFYIHHPVHLPSDADICHESLEKGVFMRKNSFQHHPDKHKELSCLPPPCQNADKTKVDYTQIESLRISVNLGNKEKGSDHLESNQEGTDLKRDQRSTPEAATHGPTTLNTLWNKYQERQRQQKPPEDSDKKDLSLVERLDRLARLLQNPITHSLQVSESTPEDSREEHRGKTWGRRQQKLKHQTKKRCKDLEKHPPSTGDSKRSSVLATPYTAKPNQIKFEHIKFNKYIVRKQPGLHYVSNTSSDSRPSEESELLTDTTANIFSSTTSSVDSECLTQTDREVALNERSSSISTIDTARLIQAFGRERVCVSPRRIRLYSASTSPQKQRLLEKRCRHNQRATKTGHFHVTTEHTRRRNIQMEEHVISSDSMSSTTSSFWSSTLTPCSKLSVHMSNKGVQAGNLEIVNGVRKHTRDVGVTFPTPSSSEVRLEEESNVGSSLSEEKSEAKSFPATYPLDRKLRKTKSDVYEGISWFVPVENVKRGPRKENVPRFYGPGVSWFEPITNTKPWREPLQEKNWQEHCRGCLGDPCKGECVHPPKPFVRANLQEALHLHRPDFIFRSGERLKRLKLIVQERKLQRVLQSERDALFRDWPGCGDHTGPQHRQGALAAKKNRLIGKKEMIQRSKRIYEQLPEVRKKKEEEKRRSEYKSYRLRAQLYKKKVANRILGRKVPWD
ncbi:PREDICTED: Alstrom syndrome protein 1 [Elephantulus edwardii]|uniref:Alstrom syndrome protein 1 n=1 Tax=Elephantulus edwardii TaxID=28737 RepID=UPI0003F0F1F7|nr:PREDICTED: Alstrom syndrome protein 1 [Elephantulus edwardii]